MKKSFITVSVFCFLMSLHALGTEIDSFTDRYTPLSDSTLRLNYLTNELIDEAVNAANNEAQSSGYGSCNEEFLYEKMNKFLGGVFWTGLESTVENDKFVEKRKHSRSNSVYKGITFYQGPALYMASLGSTVNIKGNIVGTDKLGHFIDTGYNYYRIAHIDRQGADKALEYGESTEIGYFGAATTGVYSYADLVANYKGMKFWEDFLGYYTDTQRVFVTCIDQKWEKIRSFKWEDYVDSSWDEAINCNKHNDVFQNAVDKEIAELERQDPTNRYTCPVRPLDCEKLSDQYGDMKYKLLNEKCIR